VATFNANSVRSRLEIILAWLNTSGTDVLCIQETKVCDKDFPASDLAAAGFNVVYRGEKSYNGVAIISRAKPSCVRFGLDDGNRPDETRLAYARFGPIHVVNTYVPQGRAIEHPIYRYKIQWLKRLRAYFERHFTKRMKLVWMGDMNVAPQAIDIYNAEQQQNHVCYHTSVRRAFAETAKWGFVDVFRKHHPEGGQYTFFDYRVKDSVARKMGWRVDHVLATPVLARRSVKSFIDLEPRMKCKPSDHTFLVADFDL